MEAEDRNKEVSLSLARVALKTALAHLPVVGPLVSEVVGELLPSYRVQRIEGLLKSLEAKVKDIDKNRIKDRFSDPEFVDILEESFWQAARALSEDRINYVAATVKNSLKAEKLQYLKTRRLLSILGELNDAEVIILQSYCLPTDDIEPFWERHASVLLPTPPHIGADEEVIYDSAIHESYKAHLASLDLLGAGGSGHYEITSLGRLLLWTIDLPTDIPCE